MADNSPKRSHAQMVGSTAAATETPSQATRYQSPLGTQSPQSGYDSPRSVVADQMQLLELRHDIDMIDTGSPSPRKRPKIRDSVLSNVSLSPLERDVESTERSASPSPKQASEDKQDATSSSRRTRYRSPPPLAALVSSSSSSGTSADTDDSSTSDLTWKFVEITGASIDVPAGDDGEGINGIGFRPSPQIAYARRQKRKQQVSEWRMREAKEARQKRFEKRHGCRLHDGGPKERSVRFAEML